MHGEFKVPGGKLVVVDLDVVDNTITNFRLAGDFVLEPDSALDDINRYWAAVRELYYPFEEGLNAPGPDVYVHEMPGGQYTNLRQQAIEDAKKKHAAAPAATPAVAAAEPALRLAEGSAPAGR